MAVRTSPQRIPRSFKPLLWSLRWNALDREKDKEDIIVNTINEGSLDQWCWIIETYGKDTIRSVLEKRLETEFHPESRNLAKLIFSVSHFRHARNRPH